ncbi:hypothetical protein FRB95_007309 [Tulasnella sp. JGI-2019a]|nr:hypothetical protein FRB93_011175 [Tulasnella sp. JGI-2019a]KAG9037014.1 hypothetical protein FRB95_007309 [Tulasnella sp. JGI-2019a]
MAPKTQPTSARQELIEVVQSLTQQLQKADEAVLAMKTQARTQANVLEEELRGLRARVEQRDRERDDLIADKNALMAEKEEIAALVNKEQAEKKEAQHQLSLTRQSLSNAQREAKHFQDTLALTERHNSSSLAQARKDAGSWKDQFDRMNSLLQAQQLQIDNLVMTLKEYLSRSTLTSEQPQSMEPLRNSERYVGPTITVPLLSRTRRAKEEEVEAQIWQEEEEEAEEESWTDEPGRSEYVESGPSRPRRPPPQRAAPNAKRNKTNEVPARRRSSQHYVEVDEDPEGGEDDEIGMYYEERQSSTLRPSPSLTQQQHAKAPLLPINKQVLYRKAGANGPGQLQSRSSPLKDRRVGGVSGVSGSGSGNVKKRKLGSGRGDDNAYRR